MPIFETPGGSRMQLTLPQTEWPVLQEASNAYTTLLKERRVTSSRLGKLKSDRARAVEADRIALGKAIKEGKPDPGDKHVEKIEKEIAACNRRLEALEYALDAAETDLIDVLDEHKGEWLAQVEESATEAQAKYAEATEALASASHAYSMAVALRNWVRNFPEEETTFRVRERYLPRLKRVNGSAFYVGEVLAALREDATPAEPAVIPDAVPLLSPWASEATEDDEDDEA